MPLKINDRVIAHSDFRIGKDLLVRRGDKGVVIQVNNSWSRSYSVVFVPSTDIAGGYPTIVDGVEESKITPA